MKTFNFNIKLFLIITCKDISEKFNRLNLYNRKYGFITLPVINDPYER